MENTLLKSDDMESRARSVDDAVSVLGHRIRVEQSERRNGYSLQDRPSLCAHVNHSSKLLHMRLVVAHVKDIAAAHSAPAGSWLIPGIASTVSLSSRK